MDRLKTVRSDLTMKLKWLRLSGGRWRSRDPDLPERSSAAHSTFIINSGGRRGGVDEPASHRGLEKWKRGGDTDPV